VIRAPEQDIARRVAARLERDEGDGVTYEVERHLTAGEDAPPGAYEPVTLGLAGLIVSIAALAWSVYRDLQRDTPQPTPQVVSRKIRIELADNPARDHPDLDRVVTITIDELPGASSND
jgi:hypothetical protein